MNIIKKFKKFLNDLDYKMCLHRILADAIEYKLSFKEVDNMIRANYQNHYPKGEK